LAAEREHLQEWLERLDSLTYYQLFAIDVRASEAQVRDAFHAFCDAFHPDRHRGLEPSLYDAIQTIFRRGAEAYGVLTDPALRARYDAELSQVREAHAPAPRITVSPSSRLPPSPSLEAAVRVPSARPFAQRAEELVREGDYRQAKLHLVLANHRDPENPALEEALRQLEEYLASQR
jgi:curved DNA-binding protein CbpA